MVNARIQIYFIMISRHFGVSNKRQWIASLDDLLKQLLLTTTRRERLWPPKKQVRISQGKHSPGPSPLEYPGPRFALLNIFLSQIHAHHRQTAPITGTVYWVRFPILRPFLLGCMWLHFASFSPPFASLYLPFFSPHSGLGQCANERQSWGRGEFLLACLLEGGWNIYFSLSFSWASRGWNC